MLKLQTVLEGHKATFGDVSNCIQELGYHLGEIGIIIKDALTIHYAVKAVKLFISEFLFLSRTGNLINMTLQLSLEHLT